MPTKKRKRKRVSSKSKSAVKKYDPHQPQARDEGPRLIPLGPVKPEYPFQHYLDLADVALNEKPTSKKKML